MSLTDLIFTTIDVLGTVAFALSGAMTGLRKNLDIFGVLFLGAVAALGGGVIRDMILGLVPPSAFRDYRYALVALFTSLVLFLVAYFSHGRYHAHEAKIDAWGNVFDALGLGAFVVTGMQTGIYRGYGDNGFFLVFLGLLTGIGGGVLRDLLAQQLPFVLHKRVYAVACVLGGMVYLLLYRLHVSQLAASIATILLVFTIRMLATKYRWNLPRAE